MSDLTRVARLIVKQIEQFDADCAAAEYTDLDDVWTLLHNWRTALKAAIGDAEKPARVFDVLVRYRTNSGCNAKAYRIEAPDMEKAIDIACEKQRRRRGVIRIDGGECRV